MDPLQIAVQARKHAVEGIGQHFQLITGFDIDAHVQRLGRSQPGRVGQGLHRFQGAAHDQGGQWQENAQGEERDQRLAAQGGISRGDQFDQFALGIDDAHQAAFLGVDGRCHFQHAIGQGITQIAGAQGHHGQVGRAQLAFLAIVGIGLAQHFPTIVEDIHFIGADAGDQLVDIQIDIIGIVDGDGTGEAGRRGLQ